MKEKNGNLDWNRRKPPVHSEPARYLAIAMAGLWVLLFRPPQLPVRRVNLVIDVSALFLSTLLLLPLSENGSWGLGGPGVCGVPLLAFSFTDDTFIGSREPCSENGCE